MVGAVVNNGEQWLVGVGYISLPNDIDRDVYLKECYLNCRVSIKMEDGSVINRVPIDLDVLNFIDFPLKSNELGTAVVFITEQKHKQPIIIARVPKSDELGDGREKSFQIRRKFSDKIINIDGDALSGTLSINVAGGDKVGVLNIGIDNDNDDCLFNIEVSGNIDIKTTNSTLIQNHEQFKSVVAEEEEVEKPSVISQTQDRTLVGNKEVTINGDDIGIIHYNGYKIVLDKSGIHIDGLDKSVTVQAGVSKLELSRRGINIEGGKINLNGAFEALYNRTPGMPITSVSQIGVSKTVKIS